jgi:myosin heavy subunit
VFYQLCCGGEAEKYKLQSKPDAYNFLRQGAAVQCPRVYGGKDEASDFANLVKRMHAIGFDAVRRSEIFSMVAAVLHLGNAEVKGDNSTSTVDPEVLSIACDLLGVSKAEMSKAITHKAIKVPGEANPIDADVGRQVAEAQLKSVAKMIYTRMFDDIVREINSMRGGGDSEGKIGLLDIFGFEDMPINGFEQLFINFTNERIQHLFNTIMFDREKLIYQDEGVNADFLEGPRNIDCVNLFLGRRPPGILSMLTGQCLRNMPDEKVDGEVLVQLLNQSFAKNALISRWQLETQYYQLQCRDHRLRKMWRMAARFGLAASYATLQGASRYHQL